MASSVARLPVFDTEAVRLREILFAQGRISPLLNLGSSTREFREVTNPHIYAELFRPLEEAGITVFHIDLKQAVGVDRAGDILDPAVMRDLKFRAFRCVLISSLLEHVRNRSAVAAACEEIVGPGGLILATVPSSYPYHADPIDTYYRPSPAELAQTFKQSRVLLTEELIGRTYADDLKARGSTVGKELARTVLWALIFFARPKSFASRAHRWLWYSRPYRVSITLLSVR